MEIDATALGRRVRELREQAGISQEEASRAIEVSQPTYSRIEAGERVLKGDELVLLADLFAVRAAAITGYAHVRENARYAARTDGTSSAMTQMRERLYACLELDDYLTGQGIPRA
ncbi:helix-turn-helix domain-containing protein [Cellulomonas timonensis]|uniref:helix-turn-helix domain-containing protein n=1 Tax=Cellulomonas timonensis TaxID=1689271 RepID=UPI00082FDD95|nr:helix-turn-helix transcriptional regulator [Cellulomonas timonensis]